MTLRESRRNRYMVPVPSASYRFSRWSAVGRQRGTDCSEVEEATKKSISTLPRTLLTLDCIWTKGKKDVMGGLQRAGCCKAGAQSSGSPQGLHPGAAVWRRMRAAAVPCNGGLASCTALGGTRLIFYVTL